MNEDRDMLSHSTCSAPRPYSARRVSRTADSVIELEILPGSEGDAVIVRARGAAGLRAARIRTRPSTMPKGVTWPLATVGRITLPPPR